MSLTAVAPPRRQVRGSRFSLQVALRRESLPEERTPLTIPISFSKESLRWLTAPHPTGDVGPTDELGEACHIAADGCRPGSNQPICSRKPSSRDRRSEPRSFWTALVSI